MENRNGNRYEQSLDGLVPLIILLFLSIVSPFIYFLINFILGNTVTSYF